MKLGDQLQSAMWMDGTETQEQVQEHYAHISAQIALLAYEQGWECGPTTFEEKKPGEDTVPQVPDHIMGPRVMLLVAEATVISKRVETSTASFVANLDRKDLVILRKLTRVAAEKYDGRSLSDIECDEVIEQCGPEVALGQLRRSKLH